MPPRVRINMPGVDPLEDALFAGALIPEADANELPPQRFVRGARPSN
jgi:hypothetical protein